jgi:hypothetical protein
MASPNSKATLDLSQVSAEVTEQITSALQDGLTKLFLYQRSGVYSLRRSLAEAALTQSLSRKEQALEAQVQAFMGEGLYRLITQQPRPAGFTEWSEFSRDYRRSVARYSTPAMLKVRRWLSDNGYRSYRDYLRDRAYTNFATSGEAEAVLRRMRAGTRAPRYDRRGFERREGIPLTGTYTLPGRYRGAKADLMAALEDAQRQTRFARHKELLQDRIQRLRRGSNDLLRKPYGYQSGAFAERFRDLPVSLKLSLGPANQSRKVQVRATAKRLTAADALSRAQGAGGLGLNEASGLVSSALQLEWNAPARLPQSMQALLYGRGSRFNSPAFPLFNQSYAAAALQAALRQVFGQEEL